MGVKQIWHATLCLSLIGKVKVESKYNVHLNLLLILIPFIFVACQKSSEPASEDGGYPKPPANPYSIGPKGPDVVSVVAQDVDARIHFVNVREDDQFGSAPHSPYKYDKISASSLFLGRPAEQALKADLSQCDRDIGAKARVTAGSVVMCGVVTISELERLDAKLLVLDNVTILIPDASAPHLIKMNAQMVEMKGHSYLYVQPTPHPDLDRRGRMVFLEFPQIRGDGDLTINAIDEFEEVTSN